MVALNQFKMAEIQIIKQIINSWTVQNKLITDIFNKHEDWVYLDEVSPGRNRAIYLLGHVIAINDGMLPMFGITEKLFPGLEAVFISNPDNKTSASPSLSELKQYWETLNKTLSEHFSKMEVADWLSRHTKVSEEDFDKDPLRNKLNVLIGRSIHLSYHIGQLAFLTSKA
jgi:hypothetical protein